MFECSIYCRALSAGRGNDFRRYENYSSSVVDGKVVHTISKPVSPALASEVSVEMKALYAKDVIPNRKRLNIDAVDVATELSKIQ